MLEIIPYQNSWPSEFQTIAMTLRWALGDLAMRIDHVGSTAVPEKCRLGRNGDTVRWLP